MPNLPKPRLRKSARAGRLAAPAPEPKERKPNVETITAEGLRWVNIESPSPLECAWLEEQFGFHALDLEDVLSRNQRPKIDEYPDYLFIVLLFPVFDRAVGRLNACELDMFVGPDYLVNIPYITLQPVQ
jgi:magnesium transporter